MVGGFKKAVQHGIQRVVNKFKHDKSKDDGKHKTPPSTSNNPPSSTNNERGVNQKKKSEEERTQHDFDAVSTAHQLGKNHLPTTSPNTTSPAIASPAGSYDRIDDSRGEQDHSEGVTAKSIKDGGVTGHYGQFLDAIAVKGWPKVAEEFREGLRTNAEVNRVTRYVISFNVPPDGDFYDANRVDYDKVDPKFIVAAIPDSSITSKENFWRMVYDASPALIMYVENYEAETKDSKTKPFLPWTKGDTKDYGKMTVSNKKTTNDCAMNAILEVLPDGCSNSIITRFVQVLKWPETVLGDPDGSSRNAALHAVRMIKDEKGTIFVVCNNGCGRSAMFIMLHAILTKLNAKMKVTMLDVLRTMRSDRWGAIQTVEQYLTLHLLLLDYIRSKFPRLKDQSSTMKKSLLTYVEKMYTKKK